MSRTIRRKNFEDTLTTSWDRQGFKTHGLYTKCEATRVVHRQGSRTTVTYVWTTYRAMNKQERFHRWYEFHRESRPSMRGPSRWFRTVRSHKIRKQEKIELHKFTKDPDHEPMLPPRLRWEWW